MIRLFVMCFAAAFAACTASGAAASQEWVRQLLAASGVRVSTTTIKSEVVAEGGATVTNHTFASPFKSAANTNAVAISLTFRHPSVSGISAAARAARQAFAPFALFAANMDGGKEISIRLLSGYWVDNRGKQHPFTLDGGRVLTSKETLPEEPDERHVCELDADCNCVDNGRRKEDVDIPDEYLEISSDADTFDTWLDWSNWIDFATWPDYQTVKGGTVYYLVDDVGYKYDFADIAGSDAWRSAVEVAMGEVNAYLKICRLAYTLSHICDKDNPQHAWQTTTCGANAWSVCVNNTAHTKGTEAHEYPGRAFDETGHSCVCGDKTEAHGTLEEGSRVETGGTPGGWTRRDTCPKGCGYSRTVSHAHRFVDCGQCEGGDECDVPCTGCDGEHAFGDATERECAKCECKSSPDCKACPPAEDLKLHAGWMPCSKDVENDNDDETANGAHCQCQCLAAGHNAKTPHDYKVPEGMTDYIDRDDNYHYQNIGRCTRCGQYKRLLFEHIYGENPNEYQFVSDSVCRRVYRCTAAGCGHTKRDDDGKHKVDEKVEIYVDVSATVCRRRRICDNCRAFVNDDTQGHERDASNECKCRNGCGRQLEHEWTANACGNEECDYCKKSRYGQDTHKNWTDAGGGLHKCACGGQTEAHEWGEPAVVSMSGFTALVRKTCAKCPAAEEWEEDRNPCKSGHVLNANAEQCQCYCGYYSPTGAVSTAANMHVFADKKDANGTQVCTCKCGRYHVQRPWSTYLKNLDRACLSLCAYCTDKAGDGVDVPKADDTRHTACEPKDGHCGCKCGKMTADGTLIEKFHIRKAGTCRCMGSDGNGGAWHFRDPNIGCPKICAYTHAGWHNGAKHLAASAEKERIAPSKARPENHSKTDGTNCGCSCNELNNSNASTWSGEVDYHNWSSISCECYCKLGGRRHKWASEACTCNCSMRMHSGIVPLDGKCPRVCAGTCGGLVTDVVAGASKAGKYDHTHKADGCGCECGAYNGYSYMEAAWHGGRGSPSCMCACGRFHANFSPSKCPNVCSACKNNEDRTAIGENIHTFTDGQCQCLCGDYDVHKFAPDKCECYCGDVSRGHRFAQTENFKTGAAKPSTCSVCSQPLEAWHSKYTCSRCGEVYEVDYVRGHLDTCGQVENPASQTTLFCDKHMTVYSVDSFCPICVMEDSDGGGSGAGGETGGSGGLGDI